MPRDRLNELLVFETASEGATLSTLSHASASLVANQAGETPKKKKKKASCVIYCAMVRVVFFGAVHLRTERDGDNI